MATHCSLSTKENVAVMKFLEDEVMNLAKSRGFEGIFTTNTSPLTQVFMNIQNIRIRFKLIMCFYSNLPVTSISMKHC